MGRRFALAVLALLALAAVPACGGAGTPNRVRPNSPLSQRDVRTPRPVQPSPRLIAPPPAYGNKIVMAKGPSDDAVN
ncbi:MAG TPA: hypothetical protein VF395_19835 [Polyangiaceae bacterium]